MLENVKVCREMRTRGGGNDFFFSWQLDFTLVNSNRFILGNQHRGRKYSVIVRSLLHKGQLVVWLPLMHMCSHFHACIKAQKRFSKLHVYSFSHVSSWWLFFTQLQNSMLWEREGVKADVPWLKMRHAASENGGKSRQREHECKERHSVVNYIKLPKPQLLSSSPASRFTRIISLSPLFSLRSITFIFLILYISAAFFFDSSDVSSYLLTPNDDHGVMIASSYTYYFYFRH